MVFGFGSASAAPAKPETTNVCVDFEDCEEDEWVSVSCSPSTSPAKSDAAAVAAASDCGKEACPDERIEEDYEKGTLSR